MEITYHKQFIKAFEKLTRKQQMKINETITSFQQNPYYENLNNHALHGKDAGKRAISAGGDLRLIFEEENQYQNVVFYRVGTHNQVY